MSRVRLPSKRTAARARGVPESAWAACLLALAGCADLPALAAGSCGNGVIEPGEDCDGFPVYANSVCREQGKLGQCHLDCSLGSDRSRAACPMGWGCDASGLCRKPTDEFALPKSYTIGPVGTLLAGDFDGDGRSDIVSRRPADRLDRSQLAFHFFDERGGLLETRTFPKLVSSPWLGELSGDTHADLVFSDFRVGLLLGRDDRRLVPETFSSYRVADTTVRIVGVYEGLIGNVISLLVLGNFGGAPGLSVPDSESGSLRSLGSLPQPIAAGTDPVAANIIEGADSPCDEVVVTAAGASSFLLLDLCEREGPDAAVVWRKLATQHSIALQPAAPLDGPALIVDLNSDGHLDVMVSAAERAYVAYGDGSTLAAAVPYALSHWDNDKLKVEPKLALAVGDFSGDGAADFVFPDRLVASIPRFGGGPPRYEVTRGNLGAPWTLAKISDINNNGKNDVIVASSHALGVEVYNGSGSQYLLSTVLPTEQPVLLLNVGDFDGDLTNDLAFVEAPPAGDDHASLSIAFGNVSRPPSEPQPVARLRDPEQLSAYRAVSRGNLVVASFHTQPSRFGAITLLDGSPDRIPFAPYTLVSFSDDRNLEDFPAQHVLGGAFGAPDQRDAIALDSEPGKAFLHQFWFLANVARGESTPARLVDGGLDPSFTPTLGEVGKEVQHVASCAADLDKDGRDEALWAMPHADGGCGIVSFGIDTAGAPTLIPRGALLLDQPCQRPQLASFDANADGAPDILLSGGSVDGTERTLIVLWNDGHGGFAGEATSQINAPGDTPEAFATLPATTLRAPSIVYVTQHAALQTVWSSSSQAFDAPRALVTLDQGRSVAAGDINGDGAFDLAFADNNKLIVLLAELEAP